VVNLYIAYISLSEFPVIDHAWYYNPKVANQLCSTQRGRTCNSERAPRMLILPFLTWRVRNGRIVAASYSEYSAKIIYRRTRGLQSADTAGSVLQLCIFK